MTGGWWSVEATLQTVVMGPQESWGNGLSLGSVYFRWPRDVGERVNMAHGNSTEMLVAGQLMCMIYTHTSSAKKSPAWHESN